MTPNLPTEILDFYLSIAVSDYSICSVKTIKAIQQSFERGLS